MRVQSKQNEHTIGVSTMKIAFGSDDRNCMLETLLDTLQKAGHSILLFGPLAEQSASWTQVARAVAESVAQGQAEEGILICWTGTGVSIAANKVPGIRAALCADAETARGARLWNDANVLCLSQRRTSAIMAEEIVSAWLETKYAPNPEDEACLTELQNLEKTYRI